MNNRFQELANLRRWVFALVGGILFAAFDRCGYLLRSYGSIWVTSENFLHRNVWMRILCRLPVFTIAVFALLFLMDVLQKNALQKRPIPSSVRRKPLGFPVLWGVFFFSFLPAFLGGYPGLFAADAPNQVGWTFSGWLTAHHPLLHTGILCAFFSLSRALGLGDNTAAAMYTLFQMLILSGIFAWILCFLRREKAPVWLRAGAFLYLFFFPFHGLMAIYTTKDTLFAGIFVLCLFQICQMCTCPEEYFQGYRHMVYGEICFVLLMLFRNNGFHTLILCLPFLLVYLKRYWKKLLLLFLGLFLCYWIYNGPFLGLVGAEPGNPREAYSIIMQTLGRTYVAAGDIRPQEMDVIRPVMDEDTLAQYAPDLSDPLKNYFHTDQFDKDRLGFLKTWISIGLRNKKIYIDAFLNTTYAFWYPGVENEYLEFVCFDIEEGNPDYPHVKMQPVSRLFNRYYTAIGTDAVFRKIPVVRELLSMGFYFWLLVFAGLYVLYSEKYHRLLWMLPLWTYMGTNLLGPSAPIRYAYPLMLSAPILFFWMLTEDRA